MNILKVGNFVKMKYQYNILNNDFYKIHKNTIFEIIAVIDEFKYETISVWDDKIQTNFYYNEVYKYNFYKLPDKLFKM